MLKIKHKKISIILVLITFLAICITLLNFGGELILRETNVFMAKTVGYTLYAKSIKGNPFCGYTLTDAVLKTSDVHSIKAETLSIKMNFISILERSPRLSLITVDNCDTDYKTIKTFLPKKKEQKEKTIPFDRVRITNTIIRSDENQFAIKKLNVQQYSKTFFKVNYEGKINNAPSSFSGCVRKNLRATEVNNMKIRIAKSAITIDGVILPKPDLGVHAEYVDIKELCDILDIKDMEGVSGILSGDSKIKGYTPEEMVTSGNGRLIDAHLFGIPAKEIVLGWNYNKGLITFNINQTKALGSELNGVVRFDVRKPVPETFIDITAKNITFSEWKEKVHVKNKNDIKFHISKADIDISGPVNALKGTAKIDYSECTYKGLNFNKIKGGVTFTGKPEGQIDINAIHNKRPVHIKGQIGFSKENKSDIHVNGLFLSFSDISNLTSNPKIEEVKGDMTVNGHIHNKAKGWNITAKAFSNKITIKRQDTFRKINTDIEFSTADKQLKIKTLSAICRKADITASGKISLTGNKHVDIKGKIRNADSNNFKDRVAFFEQTKLSTVVDADFTVKGKVNALQSEFICKSDAMNFMNMKFENITIPLKYDASKKQLEITPAAHVDLYDGYSDFTVTTSFTRNSPVWKVEGNINNVEATMLHDLTHSKPQLIGILNGKYVIYDDGNGLKWEYMSKNTSLSWTDKAMKNIAGRMHGTMSHIIADNIHAEFLHGNNIVTGTIKIPTNTQQDDSTIDVHIKAENLHLYEALRKYMPKIRGFQGLITGDVHITGSISEPQYSGSCIFAPLRYRSFNLPRMLADFNGNLKEFDITKATAEITGLGQINGRSRIFLSEKTKMWQTDTEITGNSVDLHQFGEYLPTEVRSKLGGKADFTISLYGDLANLEGKGTFQSKLVKILGVKLNNISAPFYLNSGYIIMENVTAEMNGGTLNGGAAYDTNSSTWGFNITSTDVEAEDTLKQVMPDMPGNVTGKANLKIRIQGEPGRLSTVRGSGALFLNDGELSGFTGLEAAKKYTGGHPIRFNTIQTSFTYDGGDITILPGSQFVAPSMDPLYRFVMVDGIITREHKFSLFSMGKVNIKALNAMLGAMNGIVRLGTDLVDQGSINKSEAIKGVLGGVISGYTKNEFSFVSMNIGGNIEEPVFSNIKIDRITHKQQMSKYSPKTTGDPTEKDMIRDGDKVFKLKFEIPIGPGAKKTHTSITDEIVEQTLDNLINNLNIGD